MLEHIAASAAAPQEVMTMDAGLWSEENMNVCAVSGH